MPTPQELSVPEKLADIQTTKTAIREAIVSKGVDVPTNTTFREYAGKIGEISGGGGGYSPLLDLGLAEEQGSLANAEYVSRVPISDANWQYCIFMATSGRLTSISFCFAFDKNGEIAPGFFVNSLWSIEVGVNEIIMSVEKNNFGQYPPYCYAVFTVAQ